MKIICPKKPSRTYLFKWKNGVMFSIFGFGLFVVHFKQGWEIRFLHPFNTGKAIFYGDVQPYEYHEVDIKDCHGNTYTVITVPREDK